MSIPNPREHVEYLRTRELSWEPRADNDGASGWRVRRLSRDPVCGAESVLVSAGPFWVRRIPVRFNETVEILVLEGDLRVGERRMESGGYLRVPKGASLEPMTSDNGFVAFLTGDGPLDMNAAGPDDAPSSCVFIDTPQIPWEPVPAFAGRPLEQTVGGMSFKVLRGGGPDEPYTYLVKSGPGWADPREESHATWEELFLLSGDYLMGDFGRIVAGDYIFRPRDVLHGPQATVTGAVFLARGERRIDFTFRPLPWADLAISRYLKEAPRQPPSAFVGWL
jgi:hypothetical protein